MGLVFLGKEERFKTRQDCVRNASKMRGTKEGFGAKKLPFPSVPDMGALSQKTPILHRAPQGKWGFFDSKHPF